MNVQLVGDNVAIEGWMGVGPDHRVREYRFPNFSINVITSLRGARQDAPRRGLGGDGQRAAL